MNSQNNDMLKVYGWGWRVVKGKQSKI
jgi:hypothetical protein